MKEKGFTLIELLAVIVVLAIIALISVPIITSVIDKAKEGALKNSAYGIIEAANLYYANNLKEGIEETEFTCSKNKCINEEKEITYKGSIDNGKVKIYSDGEVSICIEKDNYGASKKATEKEVILSKGDCNDDYTVDAYISKTEYDKLKQEIEDLKREKEPYYLYKEGNVYSDITGGYVVGAGTSCLTVKYNSDNIEIKGTCSNTDAQIYTKNKINLTDYSELYFEVDSNGTGGAYGIMFDGAASTRITKADNGYTTVVTRGTAIYKKLDNGHYLVKLNIEHLNDNYYIVHSLYNSTNKIYAIYLK